MRLVEDDGACRRQNPCVGRVGSLLLDVEIGEEQVVIDDDEVRLECLAAHLGDEAVLPIRAGLAQAGFCPRIELVP